MKFWKIFFLFLVCICPAFTEIKAEPSPINVLSRGADNTGRKDASDIIEACIIEGRETGADIYIPAGTYLLSRKIVFNPEKKNAEPLQPETYFDWRGITIYGDGWNTIFKGITRKASDTFNFYCVKNIHFRDFAITNSIEELDLSTSGSNIISIVNGMNITFTNIKAFDATGVEKDGWFDGGKGFTVQSSYAKDIFFTNCYAYNCPSGFLMQYDNRPSTNIVISRCKAEKCQEGLFLGWELGRIRGVKHTAVIVDDMEIRNCMVGYREENAEGVTANIYIKNTQTEKKLRRNAYGKFWLQLDSLPESRLASYACFFYGSYYSNINVDIKALQLNNVLIFDNYDANATFVNGYNKIYITINPRIRIVKNPAHKRKGDGNLPEKKVYIAPIARTHLPFKNSEIIINGIEEKDIPQLMLATGRNNIIKVDGYTILDELR